MRMQHIFALVAMAESGSIRSAATTLGRSQPGLTKILRQIEDELEVTLFRRTSRGVVPTDIGKVVLGRARAIMEDMRRLEEDVSQIKGGVTGTVTICASPLAATEILPAALVAFRRQFSDVDIQINSSVYPAAITPLREGQTDILINPYPPAELIHGLNVEPLLQTNVVVVTSRNSPYRNARSLRELADSNWIRMGGIGGPGDQFGALFLDHGITPPVVKITSESYIAAVEIIRSMGAVSAFPQRWLLKTAGSEELVSIPLKEKFKPLQVCMITRAGVPPTPAAREMADCIRRRCVTLARAEKSTRE